MGVYDIARSQIQAEPITNFYKGNAIRAQQRAAEIDNQMAQKELDAFDAREDRDERQLQVIEGRLRQNAKEFEHKVGQETAHRLAKDLYSRIYAVDEGVQSGELDEPQALQRAAESFTEYAQGLPEEMAAPLLQKLSDGLSIEEYRQIKASNAAALGEYGLLESNDTQDRTATQDIQLAKEFTSESIDAYMASKNPADLVPRGADSSASSRDKKIADYMGTLGMSREEAVKLADGAIQFEVLETGAVRMVDKTTGEAREVAVQGDEIVPASPDPGYTLWDMSDWATGPASALKAAYNVPAAILNLPVSYKTSSARQSYRTNTQSLIRALAINPRFPVAEQERIREEISILPAFLDDPKLLRERMVSLDRDLRLRSTQAKADAADTGLPEETRSAQRSNAKAIDNFLAVLGAPQETAIDIPDSVQGEDRELWEFYTDKEKEEILREANGR